jgi:hypothetical protein
VISNESDSNPLEIQRIGDILVEYEFDGAGMQPNNVWLDFRTSEFWKRLVANSVTGVIYPSFPVVAITVPCCTEPIIATGLPRP